MHLRLSNRGPRLSRCGPRFGDRTRRTDCVELGGEGRASLLEGGVLGQELIDRRLGTLVVISVGGMVTYIF